MIVTLKTLWVFSLWTEGKIFCFPFHICPQVILGYHCSDEESRVQPRSVLFFGVWSQDLSPDQCERSHCLSEGLPWMQLWIWPGAGLRILILFWQATMALVNEERKNWREKQGESQLRSIHMLFVLETGFGGRGTYTVPLGLTISKQL